MFYDHNFGIVVVVNHVIGVLYLTHIFPVHIHTLWFYKIYLPSCKLLVLFQEKCDTILQCGHISHLRINIGLHMFTTCQSYIMIQVTFDKIKSWYKEDYLWKCMIDRQTKQINDFYFKSVSNLRQVWTS